jgi:ParB family chromosome partitioning protein
MMVPINEIQIGKRLRGLREAAVTELMESINRLGLRTPITVSSRPAKREGGGMDAVAFDLVAGEHRLEACKRLGWKEIEASNVQMSANERELWEIDENLCRAELSELERGEHLAKRKALYEELYPQSRSGAAQAVGMNKAIGNVTADSAATFAADTADKMGIAERTIRHAIRRAEKIDEKVRDRIRDNPEIADSGVELDALASLDTQQQRKAVSLVESGKAAGIRDAKRLIEPKPPASKEAQLRAMREQQHVGAEVAAPPTAPPALDLSELHSVLLMLQGDQGRIANLSLEKRVGLARACLTWLNVTLEDLRAP